MNLPCNENDTVWYINKTPNILLPLNKIFEAEVTRVDILTDAVCVFLKIRKSNSCFVKITVTNGFGTTVFLTREEAEKALEEKDNG